MLPRNYVILVNILNELSNIVYVLGEFRTSASVEANYDISADMLDIAFYVCDVLQPDSDEAEFNFTQCQDNFMSNEVGLPSSSRSDIQTCHLKGSVVFKLPTTDALWRLVMLVPDDDTVLIRYKLIEIDKQIDSITGLPAGSFTVWSVYLDNQGRHSTWLRGPYITPWKDLDEPYDVDMDVEFEDKHSIKTVFEWKRDDADTACFDVGYFCNGRIIAQTIIWQSKSINKNVWRLENQPVNEKCELRLTGVKGTTVKEYCVTYDEVPTKHSKATNATVITTESPELKWRDDSQISEGQARDVIITHEASSEGGWDVIVTWTPPIQAPLEYIVTLNASHVQRNVSVPWNETKVTIKNVQDEGYYYIIIDSLMGSRTARTSRNAIFPEKSNLTGLVASVVVLTAIIVLIGGTRCLRKRRADKQKRSYFLDLDDKPTKDAMETFDVESSKTEEYWEIGSRRLLLHEVVGEGAFGVVRRGTLGAEEVAVKMLKDFPTLDEVRSFHAEIELMKLMKTVGRHAHVLNMVECCAGRRPLLLTEYCGGGDLLSYLRRIWDVMVSKRKAKYYNNNIEGCEYRNDLFKCKFDSKLVVNKLYDLQGMCDTDLTSRDLLSFCRQIAIGMDFLASNKVVHRDLAARNILVAGDRTLKIADFGLSRDVYEENQYKQKGNGKMPVKWMALESLERKIYTTKSDIWSFGVVVWEIVTVGGSPYPDVPPARLLRFLREGYRMQRPNNCSMELYDVMLSCWHVQPSARPTFSELHRRLDELLNSVCAHDYLSLEMNEDARPALKQNRYVRMIKEKLGWSRSESYTYPCRATHNHYSSPPAAIYALQPA